MSVKEMYMGREMTGTTTLAESVYEEMGGTTPLITESQTVKGAVNELKTIEGTEAYDNTATYAVGDYCIYNSTRYKCITAVTTAEDFDSTKWSATTTSNDISELNSSISNLYSINYINLNTDGAYSDSALYEVLKNNNRITPRRFCFFSAQFNGGTRFGFCYLYEETKLYGIILVFHYTNPPRFLSVGNGVTTVKSWATT